MTDRELMQMALDALESDCGATKFGASEALRARLAQPEPEPVAWMRSDKGHIDFHKHPDYIPLYTTPPQREWQGLTDEEIMDACSAVWASHPIEVGRVVEEKLKEKNT